MKNRLIKPFFDLGKNILDDTIDPVILKSFLISKLERFWKTFDSNPKAFDPAELQILQQTANICFEIGLRDKASLFVSRNQPMISNDMPEVASWINQLPSKKVIFKSKLQTGTGNKLLSIIDSENLFSTHQVFIKDNLELLLRHIEIKRKNSLGNQSKEEKNKISILLSRYARKSEDFRFLNAALKLNDWLFVEHKSSKPSKSLYYYLLALAETEKTLAVLLP